MRSSRANPNLETVYLALRLHFYRLIDCCSGSDCIVSLFENIGCGPPVDGRLDLIEDLFPAAKRNVQLFGHFRKGL